VAAQMRRLRLIWPSSVTVGLIGPGSAAAFDACFGAGLPRCLPAGEPADGEHLADALIARVAQPVAGVKLSAAEAEARRRSVLVLNRPDGRTAWLTRLRDAGFQVDVAHLYSAEPVLQPPHDFQARLTTLRASGCPVVAVVGSGEGFDVLAQWLQALPADLADWCRALSIEVPHARVAAKAASLGFTNARLRDPGQPLVQRLQYPRLRDAAASVPAADHRPTASTDSNGQFVQIPISDPTDLSADPHHDKPADPNASPKAVPTESSAAPGASPSTANPSTSDAKAADVKSKSVDAKSPDSKAADAKAADAKAADAKAADAKAADAKAAETKATAARAAVAPVQVAVPPSPPPTRSLGSRLWPLVILLLVGAVAVAGWWFAQQRFLAVERESARRLQDADARAARLEEQLRGLRDSQTQLTARSAKLESRIAESASQQEQLQALYDDIARSRGESTLSEVEEAVVLANQHLQLTGNVQAALLALEAAEKRIGGSDQSQAIGIRRLLLQDIEKLRALPDVDIARLALRMDEVINRVDQLPLLSDASSAGINLAASGAQSAGGGGTPGAPGAPAPVTPAAGTPGAAASAGVAGPAGAGAASPSAAAGAGASTATSEPVSALDRLYASVKDTSRRGLDAVRDEFRSLVTIRRIDRPDGLLVSPDQKQLARENLRLLLLNARLNLINRQEALFRQDVARVLEAFRRLYDVESPEVKSAIATLELLRSQPLKVNMPSLSETVTAVRSARASSEKRS
jgi:uncharacterized protein HemX/uroporphyrinogen-III synthase